MTKTSAWTVLMLSLLSASCGGATQGSRPVAAIGAAETESTHGGYYPDQQPLPPDLTDADRTAVHELDDALGASLELSFTGAGGCEEPRGAVRRICDLAERICTIAERHPDYASVVDRCGQGRARCTEDRRRVTEAGCPGE